MATLILPSKLKSAITEELIPEHFKDKTYQIIGMYHSYSDFSELLSNRTSTLKLPTQQVFSQLSNSEVFTTTVSNGYTSQLVTFYNPSQNFQKVIIEDFYLKPYRVDVQNLVMASVIPEFDSIKKLLEKEALVLLGYIGSQYPTLNKEEKNLVKEKPIEAAIVFYDAMLAENTAEKYFPKSKFNSQSDAFRHFVWSGLLVRDIGENEARIFLNTHEKSTKQTYEEKEMDLFNNERGIEKANDLLKIAYFENSTFYLIAKNFLETGKLMVLEK